MDVDQNHGFVSIVPLPPPVRGKGQSGFYDDTDVARSLQRRDFRQQLRGFTDAFKANKLNKKSAFHVPDPSHLNGRWKKCKNRKKNSIKGKVSWLYKPYEKSKNWPNQNQSESEPVSGAGSQSIDRCTHTQAQSSKRKIEFSAEKNDSGHNPLQRINDQTSIMAIVKQWSLSRAMSNFASACAALLFFGHLCGFLCLREMVT